MPRPLKKSPLVLELLGPAPGTVTPTVSPNRSQNQQVPRGCRGLVQRARRDSNSRPSDP